MTSNKINSNETQKKNQICQQSLVLGTSILHQVSLKQSWSSSPFIHRWAEWI